MQLGYLHQIDRLVIGAEAYRQLLNATSCINTSEASDPPTTCPYGHSVETEMKNMFGLNAKLGFANDQLLVYGLGGIAFAKVKSTFNDYTFGEDYDAYNLGSDTIDSGTNYARGWQLGGGAEMKLNDEVSIFAQASYSKLTSTISAPLVSEAEAVADNSTYDEEYSKLKTKLGIVSIKLGFNFHF